MFRRPKITTPSPPVKEVPNLPVAHYGTGAQAPAAQMSRPTPLTGYNPAIGSPAKVGRPTLISGGM